MKRAEVDTWGNETIETEIKPSQQVLGSNEEGNRTGLGNDVIEHELFSRNSLYSWLGHSARLTWGLKEVGMSQKARA